MRIGGPTLPDRGCGQHLGEDRLKVIRVRRAGDLTSELGGHQSVHGRGARFEEFECDWVAGQQICPLPRLLVDERATQFITLASDRDEAVTEIVQSVPDGHPTHDRGGHRGDEDQRDDADAAEDQRS